VHPVREESVQNHHPESAPMKPDLDKLKKDAIHHLDVSKDTKESVVNSDLQNLTTAIKTLSKRKDLVVMVFER